MDDAIAEAVEVSRPTVARIRKQYAEQGLGAALARRAPRRVYERKLDGAQEARLVAPAGGAPPAGQPHWSLRPLADTLVELEIAAEVSYQTVRRILKKRPAAVAQAPVEPPAPGQCRIRLAHGGCARCTPAPTTRGARRSAWTSSARNCCGTPAHPCPPRPAAARGLRVRAGRRGQPVPLLRAAGRAALGGRDRAPDPRRLGAPDQGAGRRPLPGCRAHLLVLDNLNIHGPASLYEAFPPAEAKRLADRLEIHHIPKHGSWLNMAEIELSVLRRQCLDRRVPDLAALQAEVAAWQARRNADRRPIEWRFTTADARIKLRRLYLQLTSNTAQAWIIHEAPGERRGVPRGPAPDGCRPGVAGPGSPVPS